MAAALANVIEHYDLDTDPEVIPALQILQAALNTKLEGWPNPGPVINLKDIDTKWNL